MNRHTFLAIMLIALFTPFAASPQDNSLQLKQALQLHREYKFSQAIDIYRSILEQRPDSTLKTESDSVPLTTTQESCPALSEMGLSPLEPCVFKTGKRSWLKLPTSALSEGQRPLWFLGEPGREARVRASL